MSLLSQYPTKSYFKIYFLFGFMLSVLLAPNASFSMKINSGTTNLNLNKISNNGSVPPDVVDSMNFPQQQQHDYPSYQPLNVDNIETDEELRSFEERFTKAREDIERDKREKNFLQKRRALVEQLRSEQAGVGKRPNSDRASSDNNQIIDRKPSGENVRNDSEKKPDINNDELSYMEIDTPEKLNLDLVEIGTPDGKLGDVSSGLGKDIKPKDPSDYNEGIRRNLLENLTETNNPPPSKNKDLPITGVDRSWSYDIKDPSALIDQDNIKNEPVKVDTKKLREIKNKFNLPGLK